jgi:hypothetical protein
MEKSKIALVLILVIIMIAGISIGGWQLRWWLNNSAANHNANITFNGYGAQSADIQETRTLMVEISTINTQIVDPSTPASEVPSLRAQLAAETNQACNLANDITMTVPSDISQFVAISC